MTERRLRRHLSWFLWVWGITLSTFAQKPELVVQTGHSGSVNSIAFSPSGMILASGSDDSSVKIWDAINGKEIRTFVSVGEGEGGIPSVAISPDGTTLASAGRKGVSLWDVATGKKLALLELFFETDSVAFSPGGKTVAGAGLDGIALWDVASRTQILQLGHSDQPGQTLWIAALAFSPDGRTLAGGGDDGVQFWNLLTHQSTGTLPRLKKVSSLAFSPNGEILAVGGDPVGLWDMAHRTQIRTMPGHFPAFSPDGKLLATASGELGNDVDLWDLTSGARLRRLPGDSKSPVYSSAFFHKITSIAFSADGQRLATGNADCSLSIWHLGSNESAQRLPGVCEYNAPMSFSPDGRLLARGRSGGILDLWDLAAGKVRYSADLSKSNPPGVLQSSPEFLSLVTVFSPDNSILAIGDSSGLIKLVNPATEEIIRFASKYFPGPVSSMAFSPDGKILAVSLYLKVALLDVTKWEEIRTIPLDLGYSQMKYLAFSPDGKTLAGWVNNTDGIVLWNTDTGEMIKRWKVESSYSAALSHDGSMFAVGHFFGSIALRSVPSGDELRWLPCKSPIGTAEGECDGRHSGWVSAVALNLDGSLLASGSLDGTIKLWDPRTGKQKYTFRAGYQPVSLAFSPNGRVLASLGVGPKIQFWDTVEGRELCELVSFSQGTWVVITPDGRFDTQNLDEIQGLHWVFSDDPFRALPPEIFLRDYYEPRLLAKLLGGGDLPQVRPLQDLNRVQPLVKIASVRPGPRSDLVEVDVEVANADGRFLKDGNPVNMKTGVYDLRLFRAGQLVGQEPKPDVVSPGHAKNEAMPTVDALAAWRTDRRVDLDPQTGRARKTFTVHLPHARAEREIELEAYAFNEDRVKSATAKATYKLQKAASTGAGRAYLITMGVNANESPNLNLELAVSSAERARALLHSNLQTNYNEVLEIQLYSDLDADSNQVKSKAASKANLEAVMDLLAGRAVDTQVKEQVDPKHQLRAAGPDDAVVIYIASHGYADPQGTFYLMPYDTGSNWGITEDAITECLGHPSQGQQCRRANDLLAHSISSSDLAAWWNAIDAGEMVMILDSCHSGAVPGKDFRPGPLGDRGFGQLSYDKGMLILAASQPSQTEKGEWVTGGEGRTLLVDALEEVANAKPQDSLQKWLHDIEETVPTLARKLYPALKAQEVQVPLLLDFAKASPSPLTARAADSQAGNR